MVELLETRFFALLAGESFEEITKESEMYKGRDGAGEKRGMSVMLYRARVTSD